MSYDYTVGNQVTSMITGFMAYLCRISDKSGMHELLIFCSEPNGFGYNKVEIPIFKVLTKV